MTILVKGALSLAINNFILGAFSQNLPENICSGAPRQKLLELFGRGTLS
jgi:hypothetical protein